MSTAALHPAFDRAVPAAGYSWWYVDALSDDGCSGLTIIAFIGSVFSPYYAHARRRAPGAADPANHCALNVALYTRAGHTSPARWSMTERGSAALRRAADSLQIGPSALEWDGKGLCIHVDEITAPWPSRIRGTVRVFPDAVLDTSYALDADKHHHWCPIAPCARVQVELSHPALRWQGHGYFDANFGDRPLEQDFARWDWSRATLKSGGSAVLYDVTPVNQSRTALALAFRPNGQVQHFEPPPVSPLPGTRWGLERGTRADAGTHASVAQTLEDGPFYARSLLNTRLLGEPAIAMHESLSLQRFSARWVQCLLPFRMPRRAARVVR